MTRKKLGGFIFETYKGDHRPYHVHIKKGRKELGRWDIENQAPLDDLEVTDKLKAALIKLGYAFGGREYDADTRLDK